MGDTNLLFSTAFPSEEKPSNHSDTKPTISHMPLITVYPDRATQHELFSNLPPSNAKRSTHRRRHRQVAEEPHGVCASDTSEAFKIIRIADNPTAPHMVLTLLPQQLNPTETPWSPEEQSFQRRLLSFKSQRIGENVVAKASWIPRKQLHPSNPIISCIWRDDTQSFVFTSTDFVNLLQSLLSVQFTRLEKKRIRRNVELSGPTNIPPDHKLFRLIMSYSDPKPWSIKSQIKVFQWESLVDLLHRIISLYGLPTTPPPVLHSPLRTSNDNSPFTSGSHSLLTVSPSTSSFQVPLYSSSPLLPRHHLPSTSQPQPLGCYHEQVMPLWLTPHLSQCNDFDEVRFQHRIDFAAEKK